jgi:hypothetical protein
MNAETINIIFQSITLLAVFAAVWQLFLRSKKMHRDTEMIFVQRYWLIMDRKSPQFVIEGKPTASDELIILQYLRLCEDEYDHRRLGKIPRDTWLPWQEAMREQLAEPHYAAVLEKTKPLFPGVREMLASQEGYDPHPQNRFIQFLRGH